MPKTLVQAPWRPHFRGLCLVLAVAAIAAGPSSAQTVDPWKAAGLSAVVDASPGTTLYTASGQPLGLLARGTPVMIDGPAGSGGSLVPVRSSLGAGFVPAAHLVAVTDTYMPSAADPGLFLPAQNPAAIQINLSLSPAGLVISISVVGLGQTGGYLPPGDTGVTLLGVGTGFGPVAGTVPVKPAPTGPLAPTSTGPTGAAVMQRSILATAEEAQGSAAGGTLVSGESFVALPHRNTLRRSVTTRLTDNQGNGYGSAVTAPVKDVGPWRTDDDYWRTGGRPAAEAMKGQRVAWNKGRQGWFPTQGKGRYRCNGAGIDLSEAVWMKLRPGLSRRQALSQTGLVDWAFADAVGSAE